jgi:hypothetical protein
MRYNIAVTRKVIQHCVIGMLRAPIEAVDNILEEYVSNGSKRWNP